MNSNGNRISMTTIVMLSLAPSTLLASNCDSIISHGLRNIEVSESKGAAIAQKYFNHCQKNFDLMTDEQLAQAEGEYFGYGSASASGSYSRKKREERLQEWCTNNRSFALEARSTSQQSQSFYQGAVAAWENCNALNKQGLVINPVISPDLRTVDIGIAYKGNTKSGIILMGIESEGFQCSTRSPVDGKPVSFPAEVNNLNIHARCTRANAASRTRGEQAFAVLPRGTISIQSSSDPFQLFFAEEWDPGLPAKVEQQLRAESISNEVPVGTVVSSTLAPDKFMSAANPQYKAGKWVIADGAPLPAGSLYQKITGEAFVPDLRHLDRSLSLQDVRFGALKQGENVLALSNDSKAPTSATWVWTVSGRENQGRAYNNDWEQDEDRIQNFISDVGVVTSQASTYNRKHRQWGAWNPGTANVFGIATLPQGVFHYIKVN